jgi:hypothetical protein
MLEEYRVAGQQPRDENSSVYGTFGLVAADEEKYYLVVYESERYTVHPPVYTMDKHAVELSFVIRDAAYFGGNSQVEKSTATPEPTASPTPGSEIGMTPTP